MYILGGKTEIENNFDLAEEDVVLLDGRRRAERGFFYNSDMNIFKLSVLSSM